MISGNMEDLRRQLDDILSHHNESLILNWEVPSLEEKIEPAKPMALEVYQTQISKTTPAGALGHHAEGKENASLSAGPGLLRHRQHLFLGNPPRHSPFSGWT